MKKFEYKVIDPGDVEAENRLNHLGAEGWELMCKWGHFNVILKREAKPDVSVPRVPLRIW